MNAGTAPADEVVLAKTGTYVTHNGHRLRIEVADGRRDWLQMFVDDVLAYEAAGGLRELGSRATLDALRAYADRADRASAGPGCAVNARTVPAGEMLDRMLAEHVDAMSDGWDPADTIDRGEQYVLVEKNRFDSSIWMSTHATPAAAADYRDGMEHPEDWGVETLVSLVTGESFCPVTTTRWVAEAAVPTG